MESNFSIDPGHAFNKRSLTDLKRSRLIFTVLEKPWVVKLFSRLTKIALKVGMPIEPLVKKTIFRQFCAGESLGDCGKSLSGLQQFRIGAILDYSVEGKGREEDFEKVTDEILCIIRKAAGDPAIPYTSFKMTGLASFNLLEKVSEGLPLSPEEATAWIRVSKRVKKIFETASAKLVPVYVDAEESWIQPAIDKLTEEMMVAFNKERHIVLTTVQLYRHDRLAYLKRLHMENRSRGVLTGVKIVRGAYWEKEQERAVRLNYPSPVFPGKSQSDHAFNEAVRYCLDHVNDIMVCIGTHNEESTCFMVEAMRNLGIPPDHPHVYSSQLYGMSDPVTYSLAAAGYNVTKYLPYGPVKEVIPYLIRRAEENTSIAGQAGRELKNVSEAIRRRSA